MINYEKELELVGYHKGVEEFRKALWLVFGTHFKGWTDEDLLASPWDALQLCDWVREAISCDISDRVILKALLNIRKQSIEYEVTDA